VEVDEVHEVSNTARSLGRVVVVAAELDGPVAAEGVFHAIHRVEEDIRGDILVEGGDNSQHEEDMHGTHALLEGGKQGLVALLDMEEDKDPGAEQSTGTPFGRKS